MMTSAFDILKNASKKNDGMPSTIGECESFGLFVQNKLKNYSSRTRNYVQHLISNILFSADQGEYEYVYRGGPNTVYSDYGHYSAPQTHSIYSLTSNQIPPQIPSQANSISNQAALEETLTSNQTPAATPSPHPSIQSQESEGFLEEFSDLIN